MSSFTIYGLNGHESMPLVKLFGKSTIAKTTAIKPARPIDEEENLEQSVQPLPHHLAEHTYHDVERMASDQEVFSAAQLMTAPVITLTPEAKIDEALQRFQRHAFRHIPVVTTQGRLVGIVSDRDILRYLAGMTKNYQPQAPHRINEQISRLMTPRVLAADMDTDIRYITRLFVEQHVGALPVVEAGEVKGVITRSDVLGAVMRYRKLALWI